MTNSSSILPWFLLLSITVSFGQTEIIEIPYDSSTNTFSFRKLPIKLKSNHDYALVLTHVNSAHINVKSQVETYAYISELPDILKPIFTGIPDNNAMGQFEIAQDQKTTRLFLTAMNHYDKLQKIRTAGNDYYEKTKFNPMPGDMLAIHYLKNVLGVTTVKEIANQLLMSEQFILSAIRSYNYSFETIDISEPRLEFLHAEYATLTNIQERINQGVYRRALDFLVQSEYADDTIVVDHFTASKDGTTVIVHVINTYTNTTIFEEEFDFKTYNSWSFDFTSGFFYSNLVEQHYYLESRDAAFNTVLEEGKNNIDISIGALGHFSYKFSPKIMAGISIGATVSPFDGKLRYLTGASFLFGEQKFIAVNAGIAFAKMSVLSNAIYHDQSGYYQSKDLSTINTVERIISGFYIGLTYNFINKKLKL